ATRFGLERSRYEGPTGIVGVMQDACVQAGMPAISFWAAVPHYVSQAPSPKATLALLHRVEEGLDLPVPLANLPEQADQWQGLVDQMTREDADVREYVRALEERQAHEGDPAQISGEAVARGVEGFLPRGPPARPGPGRRPR